MLIKPSQLTETLQSRPPKDVQQSDQQNSAVMMILCDRMIGSKLETHLVFIMKTIDGSRHGGQIAFPGGKVEPEDESTLAAALRETHEEVSIKPNQLKVLGELGSFSTVTTGYEVAVFIAYANHPINYTPQEAEVAAIFEIPARVLIKQNHPKLEDDFFSLHYHIQSIPFLQIKIAHWPQEREMICIWGFTARVLHYFFGLLKGC